MYKEVIKRTGRWIDRISMLDILPERDPKQLIGIMGELRASLISRKSINESNPFTTNRNNI